MYPVLSQFGQVGFVLLCFLLKHMLNIRGAASTSNHTSMAIAQTHSNNYSQTTYWSKEQEIVTCDFLVVFFPFGIKQKYFFLTFWRPWKKPRSCKTICSDLNWTSWVFCFYLSCFTASKDQTIKETKKKKKQLPVCRNNFVESNPHQSNVLYLMAPSLAWMP